MIRLVYMSSAVMPMTTDGLMALLKKARANNTKNQISGVLLYCNETFIQVLEGKEELVLATFARLKKDTRHKNVTEIERKYIIERQFPDWSMGFEEIDASNIAGLNIEGLNTFFSAETHDNASVTNPKLIGHLMAFFQKSYQHRKQHNELPVENQEGILLYCHKAIRIAVSILAMLMVIVIFLGVADVCFILYEKLTHPPYFMLGVTEILSTFGAFLAVLIAIEIFLNISLYLRSDIIPVKLVVATALMAISRKVIIFDFKHLEANYVYASAGVVLALGITYWLLDKKDEHENK